MIISEIYECLQGEGRLMGTPSVLIRTSTCNLKCGWIDPVTGVMSKCDTAFTSWDPEINHMTADEIIKKVLEKAGTEIKHVIISGGEPTMQKELPELCSLLKVLGFHITIETNGTFDFKGPADLLSISPKLSNSIPYGTEFTNVHEQNRLKLDILRKLVYSFDSYLKFVCTSEKDLVEIKEIQKALQLDDIRIYLMPEGQTNEELEKKRQWVANICLLEGYKYTDRLHVILFGKKRGV
jgi:7-carboxy-7-deazaguanine synthase